MLRVTALNKISHSVKKPASATSLSYPPSSKTQTQPNDEDQEQVFEDLERTETIEEELEEEVDLKKVIKSRRSRKNEKNNQEHLLP